MSLRPSEGDKAERIKLAKTPEDKTDIKRDAKAYLPLQVIADCSKRALDVINYDTNVRSKARIVITEIGVVPNIPPDSRFAEIPEDIPKEALFVCGKMLAPIPVCPGSLASPERLEWKLLQLDFSYYRTGPGDKPKIITSLFPYEKSSNFLKAESERIAERQKGFERLRRGTYGRRIPNETFHGLKEKFELVFERWIIEHVQRLIDEGDLSEIASAVENERSLFSSADLRIDTEATTNIMDQNLEKTLRKPTPMHIPSSQCYVGEKAQAGWLKLCNAPAYDLSNREMEFLSDRVVKIAEAVGSVDQVIIFGLGNAKKEMKLIEEILKNYQKGTLRVHGIDVGSKFHLHALERMKNIRTETKKPVKYRGYVALFEKASEITERIRTRPSSDSRFLRVSFGNTFGNFDDAWSVFTEDMKKGDALVITSDIVPSRQDPTRESKIDEIVARYEIPQWREWVLNPLYRAGFMGQVSPDNVKVMWNDTTSAIEFTYQFTESVDNGKGIQFGQGDQIKLYSSRKIELEQFEREAIRSSFVITEKFENDDGDFGCFVLEKQ